MGFLACDTIWWGFPDDGVRNSVEGGVSCTIWWGFLCRVLAVLPVPHFWLSTMLSTYRVKLKVKTQVNRKCDRTTSRAVRRSGTRESVEYYNIHEY